jgi:fatty-acyl-CoA synthase
MILPLTPVRLKRHAAEIFGRKIGVVCGGQRFTYCEFNDRCNRLSSALLTLGVKAGDRVAYLSYNCHRLLEAYYGVPQIAAILLPLNIRLSGEELAGILNDAAPRALIFDPDFTPLVGHLRPQVPSVEHFVRLGGSRPDWAHQQSYDDLVAGCEPLKDDYCQLDENAVAELFYTSGTTAHPKGVMLTHRNLYLHALHLAVAMRLGDDDVSLYTVPLFHVNSWGSPHTLTMTGGRHVFCKKFDPTVVFSLIQSERVTRLAMVPTMAIALMNHPDFKSYDLSSVKELMIGGAPSNVALIRQAEQQFPGRIIAGGYGLTETSPVATIAYIKDHLKLDDSEILLRRKASAGYPMAGVEARVVNVRDVGVRHDGVEVGELILRGDTVMQGYWNHPEETARAIHNGWLYTGDLATIDEEGYILIVDRLKDMVLSGGENIATAEIERVIYQHPAVLECAVIAVPDEQWGEVPKALITLKPDLRVNEEEILAHCRHHLAAFKVPKSIEFRNSLPKGGTGKILKRVLREPYWAGHKRRVN